jgi:glycerophosphoryl diester phosphodiesterase
VAITAHRGASTHHPENTRSAFDAAIKLGVESIEFDVRRTKDGGLVIIHDDRVDRISNGTGRVSDLTTAQILALDAGAWFGQAFEGERFLTLAQTLDLMPTSTRLNVHLKATDDADRSKLVATVVEQLLHRELLGRAFITGSEPILLEARRVVPQIEICSNLPPSRCAEIGCRILQPSNSITTAELVAEAHSLGIEVHPFYADDRDEMRRLIACGVDGILTNDPETLQSICSSFPPSDHSQEPLK